MSKVSSFLTSFEKMKTTNVVVDQYRCAIVRNRHATCGRCVEACTSGCISMDTNELNIQPEKCIGCGTCAAVCPTGALMITNPVDMELRDRCFEVMKANDGLVTIVCAELLEAAKGLYDPDKVVSVPCLGRCDESFLMELAASGAKRVALVQWKCDECEYQQGIGTSRMVVESTKQLLEIWNCPMEVTLGEKLPGAVRAPKATYDPSKREFFAEMREASKAAVVAGGSAAIDTALGEEEKEPEEKPRFQHVQDDGTLPHHVPERRRHLLAALDALGEPQDVMFTSRLWGEVEIDTELCESCRMCAAFCPTGSIFRFHTAKGKIGLKHRMYQCVNCGTCRDVCPTGALKLTQEVFARDITNRVVERWELKPRELATIESHSIINHMRKLIPDCDQLFER